MIKLLILDIDGVMTTGRKLYDRDCNCIGKEFNDRDFTAIKKFLTLGVNVVFLSGDKNVNEAMANKRNIPFYHARIEGGLGKENFLPIFREKYNITNEEMAYIGDDTFDFGIMQQVGLSLCPNNASPDIMKGSDIVLGVSSGEGVVVHALETMSMSGYVPKWTYEKVNDLIYIDKKEK